MNKKEQKETTFILVPIKLSAVARRLTILGQIEKTGFAKQSQMPRKRIWPSKKWLIKETVQEAFIIKT